MGEQVIRKMYNQYIRTHEEHKYNPELPNCIICDLDGTLAILNGRSPYDASTCDQDLINQPVLDVINRFKSTHKIFFFSGREDKYKDQTIKFLEKCGIEEYVLEMRKTGDFRKDNIVKKEMYEEHIRDLFNVLFVLDDRNQVVELWRDLGLTCFQVAEGNF